MPLVVSIPKRPVEADDLRSQAIDDLTFIRTAIENANSFTAVPGVGSIVMGATAIAAAFLAHISPNRVAWLQIWGGELSVALVVALVFCYRKAVRNGTVLLSRPFRRFILAMVPSVCAGAILTILLYQADGVRLLPELWLLLYGAGIASAGAFSVRVVPIMGISFLALGAIAAGSPAGCGDVFLGLGFGGLHVIFGSVIARKFGG